jgi:predicted nucleic acid-binding protein
MSVVVSDTSVLIHLARINRFELLRRLFSEITVPESVWRETVLEGEGQPGSSELREARRSDWARVVSVTETDTSQRLHQMLDTGEADALALASQIGADLILLDEAAARKQAEGLELRKTGTIGLLLRAKRDGLIDEVRPELEALRATSFWIDDPLYQRVLRAADESPEAG